MTICATTMSKNEPPGAIGCTGEGVRGEGPLSSALEIPALPSVKRSLGHRRERIGEGADSIARLFGVLKDENGE